MDESSTAVTESVVADTTTTDSAPVETTSSEVTDDSFFDGFDDGEEVTADEPDSIVLDAEEAETPPAEVEKVEEVEPELQGEEPLSPKGENRFQKLANDNRELKAEIDRLKSLEAQVTNEQELLNEVNPETGDYYTPQEVQRIAFQQSREKAQGDLAEQRQALEVQQSQRELASDASKALNDFPMFDAESKDYNPTIAAQADQILGANLIFDQNGQITGSRISPHLIYKTIFDANRQGATQGQASAQKATERMLANADSPSSTHQKDAPKDDFLAGLDSDY